MRTRLKTKSAAQEEPSRPPPPARKKRSYGKKSLPAIEEVDDSPLCEPPRLRNRTRAQQAKIQCHPAEAEAQPRGQKRRRNVNDNGDIEAPKEEPKPTKRTKKTEVPPGPAVTDGRRAGLRPRKQVKY